MPLPNIFSGGEISAIESIRRLHISSSILRKPSRECIKKYLRDNLVCSILVETTSSAPSYHSHAKMSPKASKFLFPTTPCP